jgi:hypothetical protein
MALEELVKRFSEASESRRAISQIISTIDPSTNLLTREMVTNGREMLGDYDFVIEWKATPSIEQVKSLIRKIDYAILFTGCRYTITTK